MAKLRHESDQVVEATARRCVNGAADPDCVQVVARQSLKKNGIEVLVERESQRLQEIRFKDGLEVTVEVAGKEQVDQRPTRFCSPSAANRIPGSIGIEGDIGLADR